MHQYRGEILNIQIPNEVSLVLGMQTGRTILNLELELICHCGYSSELETYLLGSKPSSNKRT